MKEKMRTLWLENADLMMVISKKILLSILIIVACIMVSRLIRNIVRHSPEHIKGLDVTIMTLLSTIFVYLIYIIGILIIMDIFTINTASIITLLGAASITVGLALKDTLSNIAAGVMLIFLRPFKVGDHIECGVIIGVVREISLFSTILETPEGTSIFAPNRSLWGTPINNRTTKLS